MGDTIKTIDELRDWLKGFKAGVLESLNEEQSIEQHAFDTGMLLLIEAIEAAIGE